MENKNSKLLRVRKVRYQRSASFFIGKGLGTFGSFDLIPVASYASGFVLLYSEVFADYVPKKEVINTREGK